MKTRFLTLFILSIFIISCKNESNDLKYLGEKIPEKAPEKFGAGFISVDSTGEWMLRSTYDGLELYFPRNFYLPNGKRKVRGYFTKFDGQKWIEPEQQRKFRRAPFFISDSVGIMRYNNCIWKTTKKDNMDWSDAVFIDSLDLGKGVTDWHITNEMELFYVQNGDIKRVSITDSGSIDKGKINGFEEFKTRHIGIAPSGDYLLCDGFIEGLNTGWVNLYISFKKAENEWTFPKQLDNSVNTEGEGNYIPKITPDGEVLFYTRQDSTDRGEIYWISTKALEKYK